MLWLFGFFVGCAAGIVLVDALNYYDGKKDVKE